MRYIYNFTMICLLSLVFIGVANNIYAQDNEISIIVNTNFSGSLSENDIKQIFSGNNTSFPGGEKVHIVDQGDTQTGQQFYSSFVGENFNKVKIHWTKNVLSGQMSAPKKCNGDTEVINAVSSGSNTLGYISSSNLNNSVKEIFRISK